MKPPLHPRHRQAPVSERLKRFVALERELAGVMPRDCGLCIAVEPGERCAACGKVKRLERGIRP